MTRAKSPQSLSQSSATIGFDAKLRLAADSYHAANRICS